MESCSGGTAGRTAKKGESSDLDIRVTKTEVLEEEEQEWRGPDRLEEVSRTDTEWGATPGARGGTESRETIYYGDSIDGRGNSETRREPMMDPKTRRETPRKSEQRPGGAWLAQVPAYLN
ncbi:hypothetical protein NDU88_002527 [Pleurodeles waltl]|uniref:Uncharacterized protein n=1 Tax=Pleurodeles waltl TaxID=8319 RepID=A0AAV7RCZ9_PLEWA|nr:hypothetical protein NDU88_002527 [Pleurodeles waltl]